MLRDENIAELERLLHTGDGRHNWQAACALADHYGDDPDTVWRLVAKWGCSKNADTRMAIACCVLEEILGWEFELNFPRVKQLALDSPRFADTVSSCWVTFPADAEGPVNARRWKALMRRLP